MVLETGRDDRASGVELDSDVTPRSTVVTVEPAEKTARAVSFVIVMIISCLRYANAADFQVVPPTFT